jgi:ABC-type antimicrobial peptide transport system permease subunit
MFVSKLVISNLLARRVRSGLTIAAVALSVSLVVAVTTGYRSVVGAVEKYIESFLGTIDAQITPKADPHAGFSAKLADAIRADPEVKRADTRLESTASLSLAGGDPTEQRMATVIGIDRPRDTRVDTLNFHAGKFFDSPDGDVAVIDQALAEKLKVGLGGEIVLTELQQQKVKLKIIGIVHKPEALAQHLATVYLPLHTLQRLKHWEGAGDTPPQINQVYVELKRGSEPRAFERRWKQRIADQEPKAKLRLTRDLRDQVDKSLVAVELLSYLGGAVSMCAAMFIVFSALAMGVSERQRTLAMLRAVGATRGQIGKLVVIEGIILAGTGALIGAPLGLLWVKALSWMFSDVFTAGVVISWPGMTLGVVGSVLAALAASILPAWQATRVSPLEAMTPDANPPAAATPYRAALAGLLLIAIDPFILFGPISPVVGWFNPEDLTSATTNVKLVVHFLLGLPGIMVGFFLLAPLFVKAIESGGSGLIARLFKLSPQLLRQQLSSGLWRAAGTAAALMVGLAVLVVMQVQGNTALKGWRLPTKFPDLFIIAPPGSTIAANDSATTRPATRPSILSNAFGLFGKRPAATQPATSPAVPETPNTPGKAAGSLLARVFPTSQPSAAPGKSPGLTDYLQAMFGGNPDESGKTGLAIDQIKLLEKVPGIRGNEIMPIAIASPQFGHGMQSLLLTAMNPEATMFFGIEPAKAFKMMELEFRDGSSVSAEQFLERGECLRLKKGQTWKPEAELLGTRPDGRRIAKLKGASFDPSTNQVLIQGMVSKTGETYRVETPGGGTQIVPADQVEKVEHGRFLIVTNEYKELQGFGVGDLFPLKRIDEKQVYYTIVGVVWSPGIDVIVSVFDMGRQFDQRTANSVFGSVRDARDDFGVERIYLFAANVQDSVDREALIKSINKTLKADGLRAGDVRKIKQDIIAAFNRILLLASTVAFAALAVASLGVTNTVLAGIRSRRWQFGVLRSIGVTRGQLLRLVLAEAVLLGLIACALGLAAGGLLAIDAHALQVAVIGFNPPIDVPWDMIVLGIAIVMTIALGASAWPAINVARTEPLKLLQAGRASA